jgi:arylsulfatase A-like enzyme/predicted Zn-dependent protease
MNRRRAAWITAGVAVAAVCAAWLLGPWGRERRLRAAPRPLDVVLLTLDTTRADRLGCYGGGDASPSLDGLARSGVLFRRAYAHVPLTAPSHSSLLTGLLPPRHGVRDNGGYVLKEDVPTLAEPFVEAGYRTAAFVSAFVLERRFGLARGFASYEDDVAAAAGDRMLDSVRADVTVDRALAWLGAADPRPVFAWVHLYDPHLPYEPPEPFATRFKDRPYEGEIAFMDAQVGRLLAALAARGRPALVAAVGDHGESLGEHQELTHSYFIYEGTQRVPFLLSLPGWLPAGATVEPVVRGVDLMPTLLEIAGLPVPQGLDGASLVPLVTRRSRGEPGPAYLESYHPRLWWGARELLGLRTGPWLFIRSPRPELYDVDRDPAAAVNLAARSPQEMERLSARLAGYAAGADPLEGRAATDLEAAGRLRALGYVGGTPAPAEEDAAALPDAKDNAPLLAAWSRGEDLAARGRRDEALAAYREALGINPRSVTVRLRVADTLLDLGRPAEAFQEYAELSLRHPDEPTYVQGMARCLARQGRGQDALSLLRPAVARSRDAIGLREELAVVLLASGRAEEAAKELAIVVEQAPRQVAPRLRLGATLVRAGRLRDASAAFRGVLERSPRSAEGREALRALAALADRLLDERDFPEARTAYRAVLDAGRVDDDAVYSNLALAAYRMGRRDEALGVLQQGLARVPGSARLRLRAGRLLEEAGRRDEAEREYRRAIELYGASPESAPAREALARLQGSR